MASGEEVRVTQGFVFELLHVKKTKQTKKLSQIDIYRCLMNVYEDQKVDVSSFGV